MAYRVYINTAAYKPMRCSKKGWEPGTTNNHIQSLHGWESVERDLTEVGWRLHMFANSTPGWDVVDTPMYKSWKEQKKNTLVYYDELCDMLRSTTITPPGWKQGYVNVPALLDALERDGRIVVPFSKVYDIRQYHKNMDGCTITVEDMAKFPKETQPMPVYVTDAQRTKLPKVNFQLMSESQKQGDKYIPNWESLLAGATCPEEAAYIRLLHWKIDAGRLFSGFAWNLIYVAKLSCGHWEVFQTPCNEHYPLAQVLEQGVAEAEKQKCARCFNERISKAAMA